MSMKRYGDVGIEKVATGEGHYCYECYQADKPVGRLNHTGEEGWKFDAYGDGPMMEGITLLRIAKFMQWIKARAKG